MTSDGNLHPTSEVLERYSLGHLQEIETERVEEHLLICEQCQNELVSVESFIRDMKKACLEVSRQPERQSFWSSIRPVFVLPYPVFAGAAAALVLLVGVPLMLRQGPSGPGVTVELSAMRGSTPEVAQVAPGRPLLLRLNATQLSPSATYRVEIVDGQGSTVTTAIPRLVGRALEVQVNEPLSRGSYWIRLFSDGSDPVREYGLNVK